ncbi:MAG: Sec-independent protein translocase subunit TatA/TatB, partial [Solirubrobacteraceae bacterium]
GLPEVDNDVPLPERRRWLPCQEPTRASGAIHAAVLAGALTFAPASGMGLIDPTHLLVIAVIALIVIGPRRLPGLFHGLRRAVDDFRLALQEGADARDASER